MNVRNSMPGASSSNVALHRKFRSLSKLNQELDSLTSCLPGVEIPHFNQANKRGAHRNGHKFKQETYSNLLVRDQSDMVSVVTTGRSPPSGEQQITVVTTPADRSESTLREKHHGSLRVEATLNPEGLDISQGVVHAVVNATRERNGHVPFKTHVGWHIALLRECHRSDHDNESFDVAVQNYRDYVYLVSNAKMVARLDMGLEKKKANFHKVITARIKQFSIHTFDRDDIAEDVQQLRPSSYQTAYIKNFLLGVGTFSDAEVERQSQSLLYDMEGRTRFHKMLSCLVRDTDTALRALKTVMARLSRHGWTFSDTLRLDEVEAHVNKAHHEVRHLQRFLDIFDRTYPGGQMSVLGMHLQWLSAVAKADSPTSETSITPLEDVDMFPQQTPSAKPEVGASGTTTQATEDGTAEEVVEEDQDMAEEDEDQEISDTHDPDEFDHLAERIVDTRNTKVGSWPASALKWLQLICLHEVGLLQATEFNIRSKSRRQRIVSEHILMSNIAVIDIQRSKWDDDRASFQDQLNELAQRNPDLRLDLDELTKKFTEKTERKARDYWARRRLTEDKNRSKQKKQPLSDDEQQQRLVQHAAAVELAKNEHMHSTTFSGTYHCGAIIMGALVMKLSQPGISEQVTDEWLASNGIIALKSKLQRMLQDPLPLLFVSARCCPGCWTLFQRISLDGVFPKSVGTKVTMSEYHIKWYPHTLPPFLPTEYVECAVKAAEKQALEKLRRLQAEIDREDRLEKSFREGPPSNPPSFRRFAPMHHQDIERDFDMFMDRSGY